MSVYVRQILYLNGSEERSALESHIMKALLCDSNTFIFMNVYSQNIHWHFVFVVLSDVMTNLNFTNLEVVLI